MREYPAGLKFKVGAEVKVLVRGRWFHGAVIQADEGNLYTEGCEEDDPPYSLDEFPYFVSYFEKSADNYRWENRNWFSRDEVMERIA